MGGVREDGRRVPRREHAAGVRIERHQDGCPSGLLRAFGGLCPDGLMTEVETVEDPDRKVMRGWKQRKILDAVDRRHPPGKAWTLGTPQSGNLRKTEQTLQD